MPSKFLQIPKVDKEYQKYIGTEDNFQKRVALYLDFRNAVYFHCPNGGKRNQMEAHKLKQMGVKAGVPDIIILDRRHGFQGLAIELKVGNNTPTAHQLRWLQNLHGLGWLAWVAWSLDEVIDLIDWYYGS